MQTTNMIYCANRAEYLHYVQGMDYAQAYSQATREWKEKELKKLRSEHKDEYDYGEDENNG